MTVSTESHVMLVKVMCVTLLPVLQPQEVRVPPNVVGYVGQEVILPCRFIPGPRNDNITQFQWELRPPEGEKFIIIVSHYEFGVQSHDTYLKERVNIVEQSLIIKDVEKRDEGLYTCNVASYPGGSIEGTTNLDVQEQMPLSAGMLSAIVISVLLVLVVMAATAYLVLVRRSDFLARHHVNIDTRGPDVTTTCVSVREDVVYANVKVKPSRDAAPSSNDKYTGTECADEVTYSQVAVRQPK